MKFNLALSTLALATSALAGLEDAKHSTVLSASNFDSEIKAPSVGTLTAFFAPWCGHCKNLEPVWTKVAAQFEGDDRCRVAHFDADNKANKAIANKFGVTGYPTLLFVPSDGSEPQRYQQGRDEQSILNYLNEECGTDYQVGGGIGSLAGRIPKLDALAAVFLGPSALLRKSLYDQAKPLVKELISTGSPKDTLAAYYGKIFDKYADSTEGAADWIAKEKKRFSTMAAKKGSLAGKQLKEIQQKKNVLEAFTFVKEKAAEAEASLSSVASEVTEAAAKATDYVKEEL